MRTGAPSPQGEGKKFNGFPSEGMHSPGESEGKSCRDACGATDEVDLADFGKAKFKVIQYSGRLSVARPTPAPPDLGRFHQFAQVRRGKGAGYYKKLQIIIFPLFRVDITKIRAIM